jgi:bifunctional non-homologous end joining protein LigD
MHTEHHVALFYNEGTADKEYHVHLTNENDGWYVRFEYGRRGSSLTAGIKMSAATKEAATEVFTQLVHSKKLKGYCEEEGQAPYVGSDKENKITGVLPQLLNNIEEEDLDEYFNDPNYCMQEKKDGKRILFRRSNGIIEAINRKGLLVGFPEAIAQSLGKVKKDFLFDGELIGEIIWLFDCLEYANTDVRNKPYEERYDILSSVISTLDVEGSCIRLVASSIGTSSKKIAFKAFKEKGVEGVVFKKFDAPFKPGRPSSGGDQLKFKFTNMCTCRVAGPTKKGKRSVYIQMLDGKTLVDVGKVTVLPNFDIPKTGMLVEVQYLYRHVHGALYQPVYLGVRDDIDKPDQVKTLKVKEGIDEDEG